MIFKYNYRNPRLQHFYREVVADARKQSDFEIRFWKIVFVAFLVVSAVVFATLLYLLFKDGANLATRSDYETAQVLVDTTIHLSIILAFSVLLFVCGCFGLGKARQNREELELEIKRNGLEI